MKKAILSLLKREDGVAATEFALIVPILASLLAGIIDYSMYLHQRMMLESLSRDAVQYVVQGGNVADVMENIIQTSAVYTKAQEEGRDVTYSIAKVCECEGGETVDCQATCAAGDYVRSFAEVSATSTFSPLIPFPGVADDLTLTGSSRLQYNW